MGWFTQVIAMVDGEIVHFAPGVDGGDAWLLNAAYACHGQTPARPVVAEVEEVVRSPRRS